MRGAIAFLVVAIVAVGSVVGSSCGGSPGKPEWQIHQQKENEVTALWTQIRDWRREAHMDLDPTRQDVFQWGGHSVQEAAKVCPEAHSVPETCNDVCNLADAICDNAEAICGIADELGKQDEYAQDKCANAKASCREAKQRCCKCSGGTL